MGQQPSKQSTITFHQAVRNGNVEKVNELLTQGVPLEDQDEVFGTPIHETICFNRFEIAEILLKNKSDVNSTLKNSADTALCVAAKKGLLNFVELFVNNNARINQVGDQNKTPLHLALENKYEDVAKFLIEHNANPNILDSSGQSPLHVACRLQCNSVVELLLQKSSAPQHVHDKANMTPLMYACQLGDVTLMKLLLKHGSPVNFEGRSTPLHVVHSVECARALVEAGANVNSRDEVDATPLHCACGNINDFELVELLIQHKAELGARDKTNSTPLHRACQGGAFRNAELLLQNGAQVDLLDLDKNTPLHVAAMAGYTGIANLLISHKADQLLKNGQGLTYLQLSMTDD